MGVLTIRNFDDELKTKLRVRAAAQNLSMEEEARRILRAVLQASPEPETGGLASRIRARFAPLGGVELPQEPREPVRPAPEF